MFGHAYKNEYHHNQKTPEYPLSIWRFFYFVQLKNLV